MRLLHVRTVAAMVYGTCTGRLPLSVTVRTLAGTKESLLAGKIRGTSSTVAVLGIVVLERAGQGNTAKRGYRYEKGTLREDRSLLALISSAVSQTLLLVRTGKQNRCGTQG